MTENYRQSYSTLVNPESANAARYQAVLQILEGVQDESVAGLAAGNIGTFVDLFRDTCSKQSKQDEKQIYSMVFALIWKMSQMKGHTEEFKKGGLHELILDMVINETFQSLPRVQVLTMLLNMLERSLLITELVDLGVVDIMFKYAPHTNPHVRLLAVRSLAIIASQKQNCGLLINRGIVDVVKRYCLDIYPRSQMGNVLPEGSRQILHTGVDILIFLSAYPESRPDYKTNVAESHAIVLKPMHDADIFESLAFFMEAGLAMQSMQDLILKCLSVLLLCATELHNYTTLKYRTDLIKYLVEQGRVLTGMARLRILLILPILSRNEENLEVIVSSGVFEMCATLGLEENGDMLKDVVGLMWALSDRPESAKEQAGSSDCPRVLVKILKDANYVIPADKDWDKATTSQALLTLLNLAHFGENIADALLNSGCVEVLKKLSKQENVVGMIAVITLSYIFGSGATNARVKDIPRIGPERFKMVVATLDNTLEGKNSHGNISWTVEEITLAMKCLSLNKANLLVMGEAIPQLVQLLDEFLQEDNKARESIYNKKSSEVEMIDLRAIQHALSTLVHLSYNKHNMINFLHLGPGFPQLLNDLISEIDIVEEDTIRNIESFLAALENEKEIAKRTENGKSKRQRNSSRLNWDMINDESRLRQVLRSREEEAKKRNAKATAKLKTIPEENPVS